MAWYLFGVPLLCLKGHFGFGKDVSFKGAALGSTATPDVTRISRPPPLNPGGGQGPPPPPPPTSRSLYRHNSANSMQVTTVAAGGGGGGGGQQHLTVSQMQHRSGDKLNPQTLGFYVKLENYQALPW